MGYKRYYSKSARVLKDEDKIRVASNEVESTFNPSNAAGNIKSKNLKLVTHDLFKKSKTQTKFKKIGLSEAIQKIVKSVVKKDIIKKFKWVSHYLAVFVFRLSFLESFFISLLIFLSTTLP